MNHYVPRSVSLTTTVSPTLSIQIQRCNVIPSIYLIPHNSTGAFHTAHIDDIDHIVLESVSLASEFVGSRLARVLVFCACSRPMTFREHGASLRIRKNVQHDLVVA